MLQRALAALVVGGALLLPAVPAAPAATTVTVDVTADTYDGSCADGDCSLRDGIASAGPDGTVLVPSGFYPLTEVEAGGGAADGSIAIDGVLLIRGIGETGAFIDGSALGASIFEMRSGDSLTVRGFTLFGATTEVGGPAAWVRGGLLRLREVTIAGGRGVRAGGVQLSSRGSLRVVDSLFLDNRASDGAGAVWTGRNGGALTARSTSFVGNVGQRGGAINGRIDGLTNVTLARNAARTRGGAIWPVIGFGMRSTTIAGNRAGRGGAIAIPRSESGDSLADHTVIAGNRSEHGGQCDGELESRGGNVESGTGCGFGHPSDLRRTDPLLRRLRSYGGPTPTMALREGSPAVDVGGGCRRTDQRGAPRDGPCDAGAYERVLCRGRAVDIVGTPGDDDLSGGREPDTFLGMGGDDEFQGSLDRDRACGGTGDDHLIGGPDEDVLVGGAGNDVLDGEGGDDRCLGGPGRDRRVDCEG